MKRPPLLPTLFVALAVAAMIALGVWQLRRAALKEALIARYAAAQGLPPVAFPLLGGGDPPLFRRSSLMCLQPTAWSVAPGRDRAGQSGWRYIAACRTGAEGPGGAVDAGWARRFDLKPAWAGGRATGVIASRPDHRSLIATLLRREGPPGLLLVADVPAPGLRPSAMPSIADIPNNHRGYAVQWFLFAAIAAIIYGLVLRRRGRA